MSKKYDFRDRLESELAQRRRRRPGYSLNAFARFLKMDASSLSKVLNGQRVLKQAAIRRLSNILALPPEEISKYEIASPRANARWDSRTTSHHYQNLSLDEFRFISDWQHYAILELMQLPVFVGTPKWIAKALKITPAQAKRAVQRLQRVGLIEIGSDGRWIDLSSGYHTTLGNGSTAAAYKNLQKQILQKGITALRDVPLGRRSHTTVTMAVDLEQFERAKKMIVDFQRKLNRVLSPPNSKNLSEVYHLAVSLYPVTRFEEEG